jgi:hypothetical protein
MKIMIPVALMAAFAAQVRADDKEDLLLLSKKASELKNYSFKGKTTLEPPAIAGAAAPVQESAFEGQVDLAEGTHLLTDAQEIVRFGGKTVVRPRSGWHVIEEGPGGTPGRTPGSLGLLAGLRPPRAPHEDFKELGSKIEKASKADKREAVGETECDVYAFELTGDGARSIFPGGGMAGRFGGERGNAKFKGCGKAWVAGGAIVKLDVAASLSTSFNGNEFEITSFRTFSIFDVGKTRVEIPDDAKKATKAKTD